MSPSVPEEDAVVPGHECSGPAEGHGPAGLVLSCEHAGNAIPARYRFLFDSADARAALDSHRGWDPGTLDIGRALAASLDAPLVVQPVSRLLVECNRTVGHRALWSEFSRPLSPRDKDEVLACYWHSHRDAVRREVDSAASRGVALHVGVHSFTPVWRGRVRATDIGVLYDPARPLERTVARAWRTALLRDPRLAGLRVHLNRPYRGWTNGLVTALRAELGAARYVGLELEISQRLMPLGDRAVDALASTLAQAGRAVTDTG